MSSSYAATRVGLGAYSSSSRAWSSSLICGRVGEGLDSDAALELALELELLELDMGDEGEGD
jgi:hypothetical protein